MTIDNYRLTDFLPTTKKEVELRGWNYVDVILFSGDAYVDHPSFGVAVIGRILEAAGYHVAIVPQPDWHGDYRDFTKLGRPRLFFGISPGCMDSMVNKYTAARRLRSEDAYSPDGRHDKRPEYPTIVYTKILKQLYPDVPVVLGGIEASLRRLTHFDYWQDRLRPSILVDSGADMITYGMGEKVTLELARRLSEGERISDITDLPQTVYLVKEGNIPGGITDRDIVLHSHEECLQNKRAEAENYRHIEEQSNMMHAQRLIQPIYGSERGVNRSERGVKGTLLPSQKKSEEEQMSLSLPSHSPFTPPSLPSVIVNPPYPPLTTEELDASFDLPYTRLPHPKYKGHRIPAYDMIRHSVNIHRGCFGGCAFCTISAHQGKFVVCRSKESILKEVRQVCRMEDFRGYLSDLGGPSANMYGMKGRNLKACEKCRRPSCIHPQICPNLNTSHQALLDIYRAVDALPEVKKSFIGSGVRYDLLLYRGNDEAANRSTEEYTRELICHHVSGRLKVAPEHTSDRVLMLMRKPPFRQFQQFKRLFDRINREEGLRQQIIPYFISSHPGCREEDMAELAALTKDMDFQLEQVQDFTPTPMTIATETWYTGLDPYTLQPVSSARTPQEKLAQRQYFFWYKPEERPSLERSLRRIGRADLIPKLFGVNGFNGSSGFNGGNVPRGAHQTHQTHQTHSPHSPHDHPGTSPRPQKPEKEKRGRNRRHP